MGENTVLKKRYAALMLFQFRTVKNGISNKKRVCEERIILFEEDDSEVAFKKAQQRGREEEFSYLDYGAEILFEFVGIMEFMELGVSLDQDEVWWRMIEKVKPMENREKLIPPKKQLDAFSLNKPRKKGRLLVPGRQYR